LEQRQQADQPASRPPNVTIPERHGDLDEHGHPLVAPFTLARLLEVGQRIRELYPSREPERVTATVTDQVIRGLAAGGHRVKDAHRLGIADEPRPGAAGGPVSLVAHPPVRDG